MEVTVHNRGPEGAQLHVLPTLWFRHTWSWAGGTYKPSVRRVTEGPSLSTVVAEHLDLGRRWFYAEGPAPVLVTGNETNNKRVFGTPNEEPYLKDGIDRYVVRGETEAVDRSGVGTKAAFHHKVVVPAGGSAALRFRLSYEDFAEAGATKAGATKAGVGNPFADFGDVMSARRSEADEFWGNLLRPIQNEDAKLMTRQALSGMLWSKQYYGLDVGRWLTEHGVEPFSVDGGFRNQEWRHLLAEDVISMPDKWEYPWFAAWDFAFHAVALAVVDVGLAKQQLELLLDRRYLHPNGQLSAYEWNFSDVNPPVHAWATYFVYEIEKARTGNGDRAFSRAFVPENDAQLRMVAQPEGPGRPQRLPGGFPRPRQHRCVRPQRALANGRPYRSGRRHGMDGAMYAEHDADRSRAGS